MNPFNLKDIWNLAKANAETRSPTAGKNKYMPHDGIRKAERERRNFTSFRNRNEGVTK